ncbi:MAG: helix-turn-helix domain-containing protein [bacterium]|nr:helix-turn-helix domain-containing protein [bacterium]
MVITYIVVFLLPLIAGQVFYINTKGVLTSEVIENNLMLLQRSCDAIESDLNTLQDVSLYISQNHNIKKYLSSELPHRAEERFLAFDIIQDFKSLFNRFSMIDECILYCKNNMSFISDTALIPFELYWQYYPHTPVENAAAYARYLDEFNRYFEIQVANLENPSVPNSSPNILMLSSIPRDSVRNGLGVLIASISQDRIISSLEAGYSSAKFLLTDNTGSLLAASDAYPAVLEQHAFPENSGSFSAADNGQNYQISYVKIPKYGWTVACAVADDVFLHKLYQTQHVFYIVYGICIVLGVLLVLMMSYHQYTPIARIVDNIHGMGMTPAVRNEYEYIRGSINTLAEQKKQLENKVRASDNERSVMIGQIAKSRKHIQASLIVSLAHGAIHSQNEMRSLLSFYGLVFPYQQFQVAILFFTDAPENETLVCDLLREGITRDLAEMMVCSVHTVSLGRTVMVMNANEGKVLERAALQLEQTVEMIKERFALRCSLACGGIHQELNGIALSYQEAINSDYANAKKDSQSYDYRWRCEELLSMLENAPEGAQLHQVVEDLKSLLGDAELSAYEKNSLIYMIARVFIRQWETTDEQNTVCTAQMEQWKHLLLNMNDPSEQTPEHVAQLVYQSMQLCSAAESSTGVSPAGVQPEQVSVYIEEHITDPMLSQARIAEHFQVSQSSLSRMFKREFQMGMNDYINHARVVRSLPYLLDTSLSIAEVAEKIGFTNSHTLIRVFKKFEKTTPGKYRMSNASDLDQPSEKNQ